MRGRGFKFQSKGKLQSVEALLKESMPRYEVWEKFGEAASDWESVVGSALARQSAPADITGDELLVKAETPLAGNRIAVMGGNIARILAARWDLKISKVRVVIGRLPLKVSSGSNASYKYMKNPGASVKVSEQDVKEFASRCVESDPVFPEDAAESLASLRAFFLKRFKG